MILNLRLVIRHLGLLVLVLSGLILGVGLFSVIEHITGASGASGEVPALLLSAGLGGLIGGGMLLLGRGASEVLAQREAMFLVATSWIFGAALAAMPFWIWSSLRADAGEVPHSFDTFVNCYFEATSGLTTTGATVVEALATLPRGLLLWRVLTQWLGGLGIVVLFVAVLPMLGGGGWRVYRIEAPGPTPDGVTPRIQDTARVLWLIYCGLTLAQILALKAFGMTWFNAVCHTFATVATGGFSTSDASIGGFDSVGIHLVVIVFMVLAGVNFTLYHRLLRSRRLSEWREVVRDPELRLYLAIMAVATIIVTISLVQSRPDESAAYATVSSTARHALFQVVAVQTTTGFSSADFDTWGFVAKTTLLVLMFVGASAGSTGGGIKVVRILIAAKVILAELEHVYRRNVVRSVKVGRSAIDAGLKINTLVYIGGIAILFVMGTVALMLLESSNGIDIKTAATASAATLNNIGPGLARVGATQNYAWFCASSKIVMSVLMLLGRLEIFAIAVLFSPRFWRSE